ncbi:MAG: hypothetical protein AAGC88_14615 [Bacteroidota bacterium]
MKVYLLSLVLGISHASMSQKDLVVLSDSILVQRIVSDLGYSSFRPNEITHSEIKEIRGLMKGYVSSYNQKLNAEIRYKSEFDLMKIMGMNRYRLQFVPFEDDFGDTIVWINGFCDNYDYWKNDIVQVLDGGNCFFQLLINLSKRDLLDIRVNGHA